MQIFRQVNYGVIDKYCCYLKTKGVNGALVNGTTGEGTTLRIDERKRLAEEWLAACRKYGVTMMIQIGGCDILSVFELAQHAEKIGVDCVLTLPDLFFKPRIEEDLVKYIKSVAQHCPTRPFYYYHIPRSTGVDCELKNRLLSSFLADVLDITVHIKNVYNFTVNMPRFYDLVEKEVPTFHGLKYTNGDMELGIQLIKEGRNIMLGADTILWGALHLGFDAAILTTLSICPDQIREIYEHFLDNNQKEGLKAQRKLNDYIKDILSKDTGEWVENMKNEFNHVNASLKAGPVRKPTIMYRRV